VHQPSMPPSSPAPDCRLTLSVGSMLIGALEPPDRRELLAHLPGCARCREEVVLLSSLPGLMHRVHLA
jgi:hypothetical protein